MNDDTPEWYGMFDRLNEQLRRVRQESEGEWFLPEGLLERMEETQREIRKTKTECDVYGGWRVVGEDEPPEPVDVEVVGIEPADDE